MSQPLDQAIREAAARELGTSFFLEAGAGTGKTTILVARVLEIVRTGAAQIGDVVVITFTEKAAGELRGRIRADLHREAEAAEDSEVRERFLAALRTLDAAHIETIHAFASSILRERPLEARVDPSFQQLDAVGDELDFAERWHDWIWSVGGDELKAVERCLLLDLSLEQIQEVARWLMGYRDVDATTTVPPAPDPAATLKRLLAICDSVHRDAEQCLNPSDDWCYRCYSEAVDKLEELAKCRASALEPELNRLHFRVYGGNLRHWPDRDVRDLVKDALDEVAAVLTDFQAAARTNALAGLFNALSGFVEETSRRRIAESKLNFEDLLIEARRVITENAEVRRYLRGRYKFLLVDEFQDTDPIQAEMVFLLAAREDASGAAPAWTDVTLEPGKLFLVGDPKQSIYRFRRADIAAFGEARAVFERHQKAGLPARTETISQNFRSVPEVVNWVNQLFEEVIKRDPDLPFAQPEYEAIEAFRPSAGEPRVIHLYPDEDVREWKIDKIREKEAETIARLIDEMVGNPEWQLTVRAEDDPNRDKTRPVSLRDVAILVDTRTKIEIYTDALEKRGIPYVLDGGREFFQRQEVKDIAAILRAMDDPSDSVSLVAALKSEAFACSDVELLQYRVNGGRFQILAKPIDGDPVSAALQRLRALYNQKAHHSIPAFVDLVVRESFLVEARLLDTNGRQRAANLRLIVQRAVDFAANEVDSLRPFIRWISERQRQGSQETESQVNESDDDVVRITTVHSAKGLEFPVVILAKLASGQPLDRDYRVVDRESASLELQVGGQYNRFSTPGFEKAWATEKLYGEAEAKRLLYVAATRARDYLVVPVFKPEANPGRHINLGAVPPWRSDLSDNRPTFAGARVMLEADIPDRKRPPEEVKTLPADLAARWGERMERVREQAEAGPRYVVPSRLSEDEIKEPRESEPKDRSEDESDPDFQTDTQHSLGFAAGAAGNLFSGSSSARKRGSLVHEVLYRCDFKDPESVAIWARRLCRELGAPDLIADVIRHAKSILESEFMKRVLNSKNMLRELPVSTFDGNVYVEGIADLAFEEDDGWVVMDYKTDRLDGRKDELIRTYTPQVEAYTAALAAAGMKVKEAGLWFSDTGEVWTA